MKQMEIVELPCLIKNDNAQIHIDRIERMVMITYDIVDVIDHCFDLMFAYANVVSCNEIRIFVRIKKLVTA